MERLQFVNIDLDVWNVHLTCLGWTGYVGRIEFLMVWPAIAIACTPIIGTVIALAVSRRVSFDTLRAARRSGHRALLAHLFERCLLRYALPLTLFILFIAYPPITSLSFRAFEECEHFEDSNGDITSFMRADYSIECPSPELSKAKALAIAAIVLYPVVRCRGSNAGPPRPAAVPALLNVPHSFVTGSAAVVRDLACVVLVGAPVRRAHLPLERAFLHVCSISTEVLLLRAHRDAQEANIGRVPRAAAPGDDRAGGDLQQEIRTRNPDLARPPC